MDSRRAIITAIVTTLAVGAPPARAGETAGGPGVKAGQQVRITRRGSITTLRGIATNVRPESIDVLSDDPARPGRVRVSVDEIARLEARRGSHAARGALIGGATLGLLGAAVALAANSASCNGRCQLDSEGAGMILQFAAVGALSGALAGGAVGSAFPRDRWQEVPLTGAPARVSLAPARRGVRLAVTIRF